MGTAVIKKQTAFRFETDVLSRLKVAEKNKNNKTPNATTLAAMRECEEDDNLEILDLDNFQAYVKSL